MTTIRYYPDGRGVLQINSTFIAVECGKRWWQRGGLRLWKNTSPEKWFLSVGPPFGHTKIPKSYGLGKAPTGRYGE